MTGFMFACFRCGAKPDPVSGFIAHTPECVGTPDAAAFAAGQDALAAHIGNLAATIDQLTSTIAVRDTEIARLRKAATLLDGMQQWLDEHPLLAVVLDAPAPGEAKLPYVAVAFRSDTEEMFRARGGHSLRDALAALIASAPALGEEVDHG